MTTGLVEADFCAVFGSAATLNGSAVSAVVDKSSEVFDAGTVVMAPSARVLASDVPAAAAGQAFVAGGVTYTVRQVLQVPPDGAMLQLVLSRST